MKHALLGALLITQSIYAMELPEQVFALKQELLASPGVPQAIIEAVLYAQPETLAAQANTEEGKAFLKDAHVLPTLYQVATNTNTTNKKTMPSKNYQSWTDEECRKSTNLLLVIKRLRTISDTFGITCARPPTPPPVRAPPLDTHRVRPTFPTIGLISQGCPPDDSPTAQSDAHQTSLPAIGLISQGFRPPA